MAVLEVHHNLVMVLGVFVFVFLLVDLDYFVCLVGFYLTNEKFCASEQF